MESSELEAGRARRLGERLHAPVVEEAVALEHDFRDLELLGQLGDRRADLLRRLDVAGGGAGEGLGARRDRAERAPVRRDELGVDVLRRAVHGEARPVGVRDLSRNPLPTRLVRTELGVPDLPSHARPQPPAALPALRLTRSPTWRMPLPLYGSGGRIRRTSDANCPTRSRSEPSILMRFSATETPIPSGM